MADGEPQQRHHDYIKAGNEAGVCHAGEKQADLLKVYAQRQRKPHAQAPKKQASLQERFVARLGAALIDHQWQQRQGTERETQPGKKKRTDVVHADALGHEGSTPDHGGDQHQEVGAEGLAAHVSARSGKVANFAIKRRA